MRFGDGLIILGNGAILAIWPFATIRRFDGPDGNLRLGATHAAELARLDIRAPDLAALVLCHCPGLAGAGGQAPIRVGRIIAGSVAAAAAIVGMIWFGVPVIADQAAEILPLSWEKPLGQAVGKQVQVYFGVKTCTAPSGIAAVDRLVGQLQSVATLPIPPELVVLQSHTTNALALPGGRVYVLSGLTDYAVTPDELAGVFAHEFGHISHRGGLRRLLRNGGTGYLIGLLFGDVSGAGAALLWCEQRSAAPIRGTPKTPPMALRLR